ncbi:MAG TPA: hypothetical protein VEZ55_02555, partial [Chitinophagaceae bacterium]|nr:hypothetical protein [Chitinophagaceae bacterium]
GWKHRLICRQITRRCVIILDFSGYFAALKILLLGASAVWGLPGFILLASDAGRFFQKCRSYGSAIDNCISAETDCRYILWLGWSFLRANGSDGRYLDVSLREH